VESAEKVTRNQKPQRGKAAISVFVFGFVSILLFPYSSVLYAEQASESSEDSIADKITQLEKWTSTGNTIAPYDLAILYIEGLQVEQDYQKAFKWMKKSTDYGHFGAHYNLGLMYLEGLGVARDQKKAFQWMEKAAFKGSIEAQYWLAWMYQTGCGVKQDQTEAIRIYQWLGESGFAWESVALAINHYHSQSLEPMLKQINLRKAYDNCIIAQYDGYDVKLLKHIIGSKMTDDQIRQAEQLADVLLQNRRPFLYLIKMAEAGDADVQYKLGCRYQYGNFVDKDYQEAFRWFLELAQKGDARGQFKVGVFYHYGYGREVDCKKAYEWYAKAVEQDHVIAQNNMGVLYQIGKGVDKDYQKAIYWYQKSAEGGDDAAQYNLGRMHYYGKGVEQDYQKAFEWFTKAAEQGYEEAQYYIGLMYADGKGVEKNYTEAAEWYTRAAIGGDTDAQVRIGVLYKYGRGVEKDVQKAINWYEKAAVGGNKTAKVNLGKNYYYGKDINPDYQKALEWFLRAAEQGSDDGQYYLGLMYDKGEGIKRSDAEAVKWYTKAALQGHITAQNNLGLLYERGRGVEKDLEKAIHWYKKGAESDGRSAQFNLGKMYYYGRGVELDYQKAFRWFMKAAEQGHAVAQNNLGILYENGRGVTRDFKTAVDWYTKGAEGGDDNAQFNLGRMYYSGRGCEPNYQKASEWFAKAAEQGYAEAQYYLGLIYSEGYGKVEQNQIEATKWLSSAARQGHEIAHEYLRIKTGRIVKLEPAVESELFDLGWKYYRGEDDDQDLEKACKFFLQAAEEGDVDAMYCLGEIYNSPIGILGSYTEAEKWLMKAADMGHPHALELFEAVRRNSAKHDNRIAKLIEKAEKGNASAQYDLGFYYYHGSDGFEKDLKKALEWFLKSAHQGNRNAQYKLAEMYKKGKGVEKNDKKAFDFYRQSAIQGDAAAQEALAIMYESYHGREIGEASPHRGREVDPPSSEAFKWFKRAAYDGMSYSQYKVGRIYYLGWIVERDDIKAYCWLSLTDYNCEDLIGMKNWLEGKLTKKQISEAQQKTKLITQMIECDSLLSNLANAMIFYVNNGTYYLPKTNWSDALIENPCTHDESFRCQASDAVQGESSYAMNKYIAGKRFSTLPSDVVLFFESDKGVEAGPRTTPITTHPYFEEWSVFGDYNEKMLVYKNRFNQLGGPEDVAFRHEQDGQRGCNIAFVDGHTEFVTEDRISGLRWTVEQVVDGKNREPGLKIYD